MQSGHRSSPSTARCLGSLRWARAPCRSFRSSSRTRGDSHKLSCSPRGSTASPCASRCISSTARYRYNVGHPSIARSIASPLAQRRVHGRVPSSCSSSTGHGDRATRTRAPTTSRRCQRISSPSSEAVCDTHGRQVGRKGGGRKDWRTGLSRVPQALQLPGWAGTGMLALVI